MAVTRGSQRADQTMEIKNENYDCSRSARLSCRRPNVRCGPANTTLPGRRVCSTNRLPGGRRHKPRIADSCLLVGYLGRRYVLLPYDRWCAEPPGLPRRLARPRPQDEGDAAAHHTPAFVFLPGVMQLLSVYTPMSKSVVVPTPVYFGWSRGSPDNSAQDGARCASAFTAIFAACKFSPRVATQSPLVRRVKSAALPESGYQSVKNAFSLLSGRHRNPVKRMHAHFDKWSQLMLRVV
jgi:hypothetical protein